MDRVVDINHRRGGGRFSSSWGGLVGWKGLDDINLWSHHVLLDRLPELEPGLTVVKQSGRRRIPAYRLVK